MKKNKISILVLAFLIFTMSVLAEGIDTWQKIKTPVGVTLYGATYGNGKFVVVGDKGVILTSEDGINWTRQNSGISGKGNGLIGVKFINGKYIAVGANGIVLTSEDAVHWTRQNSNTTRTLTQVAYGNGKYVAVGDSDENTGSIIVSNDALHWKRLDNDNLKDRAFLDVKFLNGKFIAVGMNATIAVSKDGINWEIKKFTKDKIYQHFGSIEFGKNKYVIVGSKSTVITFNDFNNLSDLTVDKLNIMEKIDGTSTYIIGLKYSNGYFVLCGQASKIMYSTNGTNWKKPSTGFNLFNGFLIRATFGNGFFITVGDDGTIFKSGAIENTTEIPNISVSKLNINFGEINVSEKKTETIQIKNTGTGNLNILSITLKGNTSDFSLSNNCPASLSSNNTCEIQVTFSPLTAGIKNAEIEIKSNDTDEETINITLSGVGKNPISGDIYVSPDFINFGYASIGETKAKTITINNKGNGDLNINSIQIAGTDLDQFFIQNNCPTILPPTQNCTIDVSFNPSSQGTKKAVVNINSDDPDSSLSTIQLEGIAVINPKPKLELSSSSIEFPKLNIGQTDKKNITITNKGNSELLIKRISLIGENSSEFKQSNNCPSSLKADEQCIIQITFIPVEVGAKFAKIKIETNDPDTPVDYVQIKGAAEGKKVPVIKAPNSVQFPPTKLNEESVKLITIKNNGQEPLKIYEIYINGADKNVFTLLESNCDNVKPNESCTVAVKFKPISKGDKVASLYIRSNDPITSEVKILIFAPATDSKIFAPLFTDEGDVYIQLINGEFDDSPKFTSVPILPTGYKPLFQAIEFSAIPDIGNSVTIKIQLPKVYPDLKVFKCKKGNCTDITKKVVIEGNYVTYTVYDGEELDNDEVFDGRIKDPIVFAIKNNTSSDNGGGGCSMNTTGTFPTLIILMIMFLFVFYKRKVFN